MSYAPTSRPFSRPLLRYSVALATCLGTPWAMAAGMKLEVEIPRLEVAEYHRPYVAMWLERTDKSSDKTASTNTSPATTLAVWYDVKKRDGEGTKWLKDMRQWWRRAGRDLSMPVDGVSGPTRPVGKHQLSLADNTPPLNQLPAGSYKLVVEAARENGGRELVHLAFDWPPAKASQASAQGTGELGAVTLELKP